MIAAKEKTTLSFDAFSQKYSFYIPESHKSFLSKDDLNHFLRARYDFFKNFTEEIKLRVYRAEEDFLWLSSTTIIEVLMPDSPFIVDTIVDYCTANNNTVELIIHPIFSVTRNESGDLLSVDFAEEDGMPESYVYLEINRLTDGEIQDLRRNLTANLKELRGVVTDYQKMLPLLNQMTFTNEAVTKDFGWLKENFVLLGMVSMDDDQLNGKNLGLFRQKEMREKLAQEIKRAPKQKNTEGIIYRETEIHSNVNKHRQIYMAVVCNADQKYVLAGHFRHRSEIAVRYYIPAVKRMIENMAEDLRVPETSYMHKELYKTAQSLPVGLLMTRSREFLLRWFVKIISNMYAKDVNYDLSIDKEYNIVWANVILPQADAGKIPGRMMNSFFRQNNIQLRHTFKYPLNQIETVFLAFRWPGHTLQELKILLEAKSHDLFSTWSSRFREQVYLKSVGPDVDALLNRFLIGMSPDYEVHQDPTQVFYDLDTLEQLKPEDGPRVGYFTQYNGDEDFVKIYSCEPKNLSALVPILTDFGFTVNRENTFPYKPGDEVKYTYVFTVPRDPKLQQEDRSRIAVAIQAVLNDQTTTKPINELVRVAGLTLRQLELTKALCGYYYKIETSYTFSSIQKCLAKNTEFSRNLILMFEAKFNPQMKESQYLAAKQALEATFRNLDSVLEENICRALLNVVTAAVRTNYFLNKAEISIKIASRMIDNIPKPVPYFEIYVYSHAMEGIHLRGGAVARGGIRWSDRQDDFRTEVLGLMKAQMVKNTVIVPVGSKGGFVLKYQNFANRAALLEAGVSAYKRYITCLLELTDNLSGDGKAIPAANVKRYDEDDPYLVVAADKGTATFSDIANEISMAHGFWLTDAFASGGSNGYDHKKQGITAKGAWQSVKRHFWEMAIDPERNEITAVGIGDMAGDVFGNGMILSSSMRLVAAFNHVFIFLDPDPDAAVSFKERQRLFETGGNWDAHDSTLISKGGGVFERNSRSIEISPQVRERLGIKAKTLSGEGLIKAILRAPVDLIWNGGIGTYVKASHETHFQAGDPTNDRVRIDASELRARVIAEGGNLGLTQAARIDAAESSVRLNTDAIDNSAGVNMSDHEVNLKILLNILVRKKKITEQQRSEIIRKYETDEINLVLAQNYKNNLGLSLDTLRAPRQFIYIRAIIRHLNRVGIIDRAQDNIPFESELDRLEHSSHSLPRPVLCSLVGFAKLYGTQLFLDSDEFRDPWYDRYVLRYFPQEISKKYEKFIKNHPLKREIVITEVINELVNHAGVAFLQRVLMATQRPLTEITAVYMRLSEFLHLSEMRFELETFDLWISAKLNYEYLLNLEEKVYKVIKKLLESQTLLTTLNEKDSEKFAEMLNEAAEHSTYRLPRKLKAVHQTLPEQERERALSAFRRIDIIDDTLSIYMHNKLNQHTWQVASYFAILQQFKIRELRQILKDLRAGSSWEISFFSRVELAIETLLARLLETRSGSGKETDAKLQKVKTILREILEMHASSQLSIATFHEMVQYLNGRVLT